MNQTFILDSHRPFICSAYSSKIEKMCVCFFSVCHLMEQKMYKMFRPVFGVQNRPAETLSYPQFRNVRRSQTITAYGISNPYPQFRNLRRSKTTSLWHIHSLFTNSPLHKLYQPTLIKKKRKFSSYTSKFREEQLQSYILGKAS